MPLDLITLPFADQGDKSTPPQSSPTGFANFLDGYTKDYEISLKSGNPQAKAVERMIQNYLFNQSTSHQQAWQQFGLPVWFSTMSISGSPGYPINAQVIRQRADGIWYPYRSLINNNTTDPLTSPSTWEYVWKASEIFTAMPMPSGAGNPKSEIIIAPVDFNTLTISGTYEVQSMAVAAACSNLPTTDGTGAYAGMLEIKAWSNGASNFIVQRYLNVAGRIFTRSFNVSWSNWATESFMEELRSNSTNYGTATAPTANNYVISVVPSVGSRANSMRLFFKVPAGNTSACTLSDSIGTSPLVSIGLTPLLGGEIVAGGVACVEWNSTASGTGAWVLIYCEGAAQQLPTSSFLTIPPARGDKSSKIPDTAFVNSVAAHGQCRLSVTNSSLAVLSPFNGDNLFINGVAQRVPGGGALTISNAGFGTFGARYIYAYMNGANMALEASTTAYATGAGGVIIKSGDPTRTLVGMLGADASGGFADNISHRGCLNWFQRRQRASGRNGEPGQVFSNTSIAELSPAYAFYFMCWGDETIVTGYNGEFSTTGVPGSSAVVRAYMDTTPWGPSSGVAGESASKLGLPYATFSAGTVSELAVHKVGLYGNVTAGSSTLVNYAGMLTVNG